ncbi:hypothetical protein RvY_10604 [Ramazzottius varieornatus]|uniref:Uncharacterized protein n=1 Tax=Ramazzottius varieornatus TaxID=947166 RepID=A0A1D1VDC0_RAMVA|nr:hypothetical protein RvY_10604 [Ramazzottius varieornatus]
MKTSEMDEVHELHGRQRREVHDNNERTSNLPSESDGMTSITRLTIQRPGGFPHCTTGYVRFHSSYFASLNAFS